MGGNYAKGLQIFPALFPSLRELQTCSIIHNESGWGPRMEASDFGDKYICNLHSPERPGILVPGEKTLKLSYSKGKTC